MLIKHLASSADDSDASFLSADDLEDKTEQGPPLRFNEQLQDHTESIEPSGVPRDAAASSVKALRSGLPVPYNAKMQEIYEEHKRWIVAGEMERLVTAQVLSYTTARWQQCAVRARRISLLIYVFVRGNSNPFALFPKRSLLCFRCLKAFFRALLCSSFLCKHSQALSDTHLTLPASAIGPEDTRR